MSGYRGSVAGQLFSMLCPRPDGNEARSQPNETMYVDLPNKENITQNCPRPALAGSASAGPVLVLRQCG